MLNYRTLETTYGTKLRRDIRHLENTIKKLGRYSCHLHFNLQCKRNDIIPKHARINGRWKGKAEKNIIKRAERSLLNNKIGEIVTKRQKLEKEVEQTKDEIK